MYWRENAGVMKFLAFANLKSSKVWLVFEGLLHSYLSLMHIVKVILSASSPYRILEEMFSFLSCSCEEPRV